MDRKTEKLIFRLLFGGSEGSIASDRCPGGFQMESAPGGGRQFHFRCNRVEIECPIGLLPEGGTDIAPDIGDDIRNLSA